MQRFEWRHAQLDDVRVLQSPHVFKFTLNTGLVPLSVDLNLGDVFHCNPVFSDRVDRFCRQMKVAIIAGKKLAYFSQFQMFLPQCLLSPCIHRALTRGKSVCPPSRKLKTNRSKHVSPSKDSRISYIHLLLSPHTNLLRNSIYQHLQSLHFILGRRRVILDSNRLRQCRQCRGSITYYCFSIA